MRLLYIFLFLLLASFLRQIYLSPSRSGVKIEIVLLPALTWQLLPDNEASKAAVLGPDPPVPVDEVELVAQIEREDAKRKEESERSTSLEGL